MKANELRIGNYVFYEAPINNGCVEVHSIKILTHRIDINGRPQSYYKPIPITEEIILKCKGAKSSYTSNPELIGASKKYDLGSIIIFQPNEDESVFYTCINEYMDNLIVDALHQLQNLYFALTGQELEINL